MAARTAARGSEYGVHAARPAPIRWALNTGSASGQTIRPAKPRRSKRAAASSSGNWPLVSTAERTYVIRVVGGKTELVDVQKGDENAGQVQVFGALKAGDVVLKAGNEEIGKDEPVQVALASR